jgi:hypothetical protein
MRVVGKIWDNLSMPERTYLVGRLGFPVNLVKFNSEAFKDWDHLPEEYKARLLRFDLSIIPGRDEGEVGQAERRNMIDPTLAKFIIEQAFLVYDEIKDSLDRCVRRIQMNTEKETYEEG